MAGSNLLLQDEQVLFAEGDEADGMFLVRRGELKVFLERDGTEVKLATVGTGGMIGEMAFFDKKPRSASVKSVGETELTKISNDDFSKLMKQIPKWFVSLMSSLSTRLRDTNGRLQKLESEQKGLKDRYETILKLLHVLDLLWAKDGVKDGKDICLTQKSAEAELAIILKMEPSDVESFFKALVQVKMLSTRTDQYKNAVLVQSNRGILTRFAAFIDWFLKNYENQSCLPDSVLEMLKTGLQLTKESAYDNFSVGIDDLVAAGDKMELDTEAWSSQLPMLKVPTDAWQLVKVSATQIGIRLDKKLLPEVLTFLYALASLAKAGLDR